MSDETKTVFHRIGVAVGLTAADCLVRCKSFSVKAHLALIEAAEKPTVSNELIVKLFNAAAREKAASEAAEQKASIAEFDDDETVDMIVDSPIQDV